MVFGVVVAVVAAIALGVHVGVDPRVDVVALGCCGNNECRQKFGCPCRFALWLIMLVVAYNAYHNHVWIVYAGLCWLLFGCRFIQT